MKLTKDVVYEFIQQKIYADEQFHNGIDTHTIADSLGMQRTNISAYLNTLVKEKKLVKSNTRPVLYSLPKQQHLYAEKSCFTRLIGHNNSLRNSIQLAKAAVLYPKASLHVLIMAQPGSGVSTFVKMIYEFAKASKVLKQEENFVKINGRHYTQNISALDDVIFADHDDFKNSAFYKSKGGILFIDSFDLLNVKQQNRIFNFLENGTIMNNNSVIYDCKDTMLILSISQANENYSRKIPVIIELPSLQDRPLEERFKLINHFFKIEAENAKKDIKVTIEAIKALMMAEYKYNIKELEMEIKSACANAYVRVVNERDHEFIVYLNDFNQKMKKALIKMKNKSEEADMILGETEFIIYHEDQNQATNEDHSEEIYQMIKKQYDELYDRGVEQSSIENVINTHIKNLFHSFEYYKQEENGDLTQLSKVVNQEIIELVQEWLKKCQNEFKREFQSKIFYGLCLHLNSLVKKDRSFQQIEDYQVTATIQKYPKEYAASVQFAMMLKKKFELELPTEEIVLITMFLTEPEEDVEDEYPVLLYIMHGEGIAKGLKEVTTALTQCQNVYSFDMGLEKESKEAMSELKELVKEIDRGKGIIVIYDMGSIQTMIETIAEETNIKIRCLNIPITLFGIDISRKCAMEHDIDYVFHAAKTEIRNLSQQETHHKNNIIITLCHTGEGGATQLKNYIDQYSLLDMKTIALSISNREELLREVIELKKIYNIHTFVGTYDPKLLGIPFISITKIFESKREDLDHILMFQPINALPFDYSEVYKFLKEQFLYASIAKIQTVMPELVDEISIVYSLNDDRRLGLLMHLACLMERLLAGEQMQKNKDTDRILHIFDEDYQYLRKKLKVLEKTFKIIIDDHEIATLIMIVKNLKEFE